jgi:uncharacterized protein (DUF4415 family)
MKKKPDPYKLDKAAGDREWTAADFKAARPIADLQPDFAKKMNALSKKSAGRPKIDAGKRKVNLTIRVRAKDLSKLRKIPGYQTKISELVHQFADA